MESLTLEAFKKFMQCAPANIFFKDTQCRYYFTSEVCELVMAGEDGTLVGKTDLEIQKDPELGKFYFEDDKKILATGEGSQYVNAIPTAEGELSYFEIKKNAVRDSQGNIIGIVGIVSDVTDRVVADKKKRRDDVVEDNSVKSGFLSNMSHVLRTPMNGIIGMIELADKYPGNLDIQQKCRDKIRDLSGKLSSVVTDILEISRLESGDSADRKVSFDLSEVLMLSNTHAQRQAEEKNIQYIIDWDRSDWENADSCHAYVVGNAFYVEHILTSVADNAVKFTNPGGNIHVWCREIESDSEKVVYEFSCQDNGIGMSPEFVSHAFDLFTQENDCKNGKYEGSGLGLAITKRMVERLGGRIDISSEKNKGTTVTMTIPFEIGSADEFQKEENIENVSLQGLRALVVEDNELNMEIVEYILESNGMIVDKAVDGLEAVDKFKHSKPGYYNVILMDIMMPNMDGWEAARKIRAMRRYDAPVIPIIAMSANSFAEDIVKSRISGMNQHLPKPIDANKLLAEIKKYIKLEQD